VARDHLTLQWRCRCIRMTCRERSRSREHASDGASCPSRSTCWNPFACLGRAASARRRWIVLEHGVAVNYLSEFGYLQARMTGVADTSVLLRARNSVPPMTRASARRLRGKIIAGKLQNSRNSLLRAARETDSADERARVTVATECSVAPDS